MACKVTTAALMATLITDRGQVPPPPPSDTVYGSDPCGSKFYVNQGYLPGIAGFY